MKAIHSLKTRLFLAGGIVGTLAPLGLQAAPLPGIVHCWNFDEGPDWHDSAYQTSHSGTTTHDYAGSANATLQNMGVANWISGRQYTALEFDGVHQYLDLGTDLGPTLGGTSSVTFWIRTTQTGTISSSTSPGVAGSATTGGIQVGWLDNLGRIGISVDNTLVVRSASTVNDGEWHHVVFTRNADTGVAQVYLDGALSASATGPTGTKSNAFTSFARLENGGTAIYFSGRLDQVSIFDEIIAGSTVTTLYTNHAPKTWATNTKGVNNRAFTTASVFSKCHDVERDTLSVSSFTQPVHGAVVHNGDGSFEYTASGNHIGTDSFEVVIEDGKGNYRRTTMNVDLESEPTGGGMYVLDYTGFVPLESGGSPISHSGMRVPRVLDWDVDGKQDLLVGAGGYVWRYLNTGTTSAPAFGTAVKVQAAGTDIYAGTATSPIALADLTGDGVDDLIVADSASKLRIYENTAGAGQPPVYAAYTIVKDSSSTDLVLSNRRFDIGDWNGDGLPDIVTGTQSTTLQLHLNTGTAIAPRFDAGQTLFSGAYNLYPRIHDLNGNGINDLLWGVNLGSVKYWRDASVRPQSGSKNISITTSAGAAADIRTATDGAILDVADLNGDGKPDLIIGGHSGTEIHVAYGAPRTIAQSIAAIEAIYDAHPTGLGAALTANSDELLNEVNAENENLISYLENGTLGTREAVYNALAAHIATYPFLTYQALDSVDYHHVPSIVLQNWVILGHALPDTPSRREDVADIMGLTGTMRSIYLESRLALGDNGLSVPAAYGTIRNLLLRHSREHFPDAVLTINQLYGDGRGGFIWTPNSTKNTFGDSNLGSASEWAGDLVTAVNGILGAGATNGDYFTFVMGHEVTHSLDAYVRSRANQDLSRRWGLMICTAGGPDIVTGTDGWWDIPATKAHFQTEGLWDGQLANWDAAWTAYWNSGNGAAFRNLSFLRSNIDGILKSPQESLATHANHHFANGPGRLIGATDRFRRAGTLGLPPLKANINVAVTFIDFLSGGMNRVNLVETKYQATPQQVNWFDHYADLTRDDNGRITRIVVDGMRYDLTVNADGVVTDLDCSIVTLSPDNATAVSGVTTSIDVLANDSRLDGKAITAPVTSFTQPVNGIVTFGTGGQLDYQSNAGFHGSDSFTYTVGTFTTTVSLIVSDSDPNAPADTDGDGYSDTLEIVLGTDSASSSSHPPACYDGLNSWWRLDEKSGSTAADSTGRSGSNGTLLNGAAWTTGCIAGGTSLNGSNQSIQIAAPNLAAPRVTLSAWVKRNGSQNSGTGIAFSRSSAACGLMFGPSDELRYTWNGANSTFSSGLTVPDGSWTFCALVIEETKATLYMKPEGGAMQIAVNTGSHAPGDLSASLYLGWDEDDTLRRLNGSVDDARLYARALSAGEMEDVASAPLSSPWISSDIGSVGVPGNSMNVGPLTLLTGSGADINSTADAFRFTYQTMIGDGSITLRVVTQQNTHASAKAGVMIRETLAAGSKNALLALRPAAGPLFNYRLNTGGGTTQMVALSGTAPRWLRLTRTGDVLSAYRSTDGVNWTQTGTDLTLVMSSTVYVGIAVTSRNNSVSGTATFDGITVVP